MALFGSAFVAGKVVLNTSVPPILFGSLRLLIVLICLIPFWRFKIPSKKYIFPLIIFSLSMGVGVTMCTYLALNASSIVSPVIIGSQLTVPFAIILSSLFINEKISYKKWFFVLSAFAGIVLIGFDPKLVDNTLALCLTTLMALFYSIANVSSRKIKNINIVITNGFMALTGLVVLIILSYIFEGDPLENIKNIEFEVWFLILHSGLIVSVCAHMSLFYLYKYYSVGQVLPFYALFPVFGLIQTFLIFGEIPSLLVTLGGIIVISSVYMVQKVK